MNHMGRVVAACLRLHECTKRDFYTTKNTTIYNQILLRFQQKLCIRLKNIYRPYCSIYVAPSREDVRTGTESLTLSKVSALSRTEMLLRSDIFTPFLNVAFLQCSQRAQKGTCIVSVGVGAILEYSMTSPYIYF